MCLVHHSVSDDQDKNRHMSFLMVVITAILESKGKLSPDSFRACSVLAFAATSLATCKHGTMNPGAVRGQVHVVWGVLHFVIAFVMGHLVRNPTSTFAHVGTLGSLIVAQTWLITSVSFEGGMEMNLHLVPTSLASQTLCVRFAIVLVGAFCPKPCDDLHEVPVETSSEHDALKTDISEAQRLRFLFHGQADHGTKPRKQQKS